jgi:tetratricopeptide (TPR) repeat protein
MRNDLWTDPVAFYRAAVEVHPESPRLWQLFGGALKDDGRRTEATAALTHAVRLHPGFAVGLVELGVLYADAGRLAEAEGLYRRALAIVDFPVARRNLGIVLTRQRRDAEALEEFAAVTRRVADPQALMFEALTAHDLGRREQALRAARRLAAVDPERAAKVFAAIGAAR